MKLRILLTILALILMVSTRSYANDSSIKDLEIHHDLKSVKGAK